MIKCTPYNYPEIHTSCIPYDILSCFAFFTTSSTQSQVGILTLLHSPLSPFCLTHNCNSSNYLAHHKSNSQKDKLCIRVSNCYLKEYISMHRNRNSDPKSNLHNFECSCNILIFHIRKNLSYICILMLLYLAVFDHWQKSMIGSDLYYYKFSNQKDNPHNSDLSHSKRSWLDIHRHLSFLKAQIFPWRILHT